MAIKKKRITSETIRIIRVTYKNAKLLILNIHENISQSFQINAGVKLECLLLSQFFGIILNDMISKVRSKRRGVTCSLLRQIQDFDYSDDICSMQAKLDGLEIGLAINIKAIRPSCCRANEQSTLITFAISTV